MFSQPPPPDVFVCVHASAELGHLPFTQSSRQIQLNFNSLFLNCSTLFFSHTYLSSPFHPLRSLTPHCFKTLILVLFGLSLFPSSSSLPIISALFLLQLTCLYQPLSIPVSLFSLPSLPSRFFCHLPSLFPPPLLSSPHLLFPHCHPPTVAGWSCCQTK